MKYKILLYTLGNVMPKEKTRFTCPNPAANPMLQKRSQEFYDCLYDQFDIVAWACGRHSVNPYTMRDNEIWGEKMLNFVSKIRQNGMTFDFSIQMSGHPNMVHPYDYFVFTDGIARELDFTILDNISFPLWEKNGVHEQDALYQNACGIISFSNLGQHVLNTYHRVPPNRTTVICPQIDTSDSSLCVQDPYKLLFVGADKENKGVKNLLKAFAELRKDSSQYSLTLVGLSDFYCGLPGVSVMPFISDAYALTEIYKEHGIFIMPSYKENLGLVYLEAMLHGLPVIVTSRGGMAEYVRKAKSGIVVSPDNVDEIVAAVKTIQNQYLEFSFSAVHFATMNAKNEIVSDRILDFIDSCYQKKAHCADYVQY